MASNATNGSAAQTGPRFLWALRSRKVQVSIVALIVSYAGYYGLNVPGELILGVLGTGIALVLGIAIEDHGEKTASTISIEGGTLERDTTLNGKV